METVLIVFGVSFVGIALGVAVDEADRGRLRAVFVFLMMLAATALFYSTQQVIVLKDRVEGLRPDTAAVAQEVTP